MDQRSLYLVFLDNNTRDMLSWTLEDTNIFFRIFNCGLIKLRNTSRDLAIAINGATFPQFVFLILVKFYKAAIVSFTTM